jgi:hypothetical protein
LEQVGFAVLNYHCAEVDEVCWEMEEVGVHLLKALVLVSLAVADEDETRVLPRDLPLPRRHWLAISKSSSFWKH